MKNPFTHLDLGIEGWAIVIIEAALIVIVVGAAIMWLTFP